MHAEIRNPQGELLEYTWHEGSAGGGDVVVLGHGVTANKDRPFLLALAESLSAAGIAVLRFSFAGNGGSEGSFEEATITKEVEDLGAVLDAMGQRRVIYAGHSMGGAVGVLRASVDPRIACLISLAGMVDTAAFAVRKFGDQVAGSSFMWDKPDCPLSQGYMDDMASIGTVVELGAQIGVPWLLVHGDADTVVPLQDSRDIVARAPTGELVELPGVDHVFSGDGEAAMVEAVAGWLVPRLS